MTRSTPRTIALLSPGAMGSAVGARLSAAGLTVLTSFEGRSSASIERAKAAGMASAGDAELAGADIILSIVPPAEALPLVERLLPHLAGQQEKPVYVDANALSPESKRHLAERLATVDCAMVDGSIIGPPPTDERRRTALYLAGSEVERAVALHVPGLVVERLDGLIGAAAALKMCFGGINKGVVGLASAIFLAAERNGAAGALKAEMAASIPDLLTRFGAQIPDMFPKAYRWVAEMQEIAGFLGDDPDAAALFEGFAGIFERIAADMADGKRDVDVLSRAVAAD